MAFIKIETGERNYHTQMNQALYSSSNAVRNGLDVASVTDMNVTLNSGSVLYRGSIIDLDSAVVTISNGDPSYPRIDLIVYDGSQVTVLEGTPSGDPKPPDYEPYDYTVLHQVYVEANASSLTTNDIKDMRVLCNVLTLETFNNHADDLNNPHQTTISNLSDTSILSPQTGNILFYDGSNWVNQDYFIDSPFGTSYLVRDSNLNVSSVIIDTSGEIVISDCEDTTNWSGTSVTQDTTVYIVGTASVKDEVTTPTASTDYSTIYTPSSALDLSSKKYIYFKFRDSRASTDYTAVKLVVKTDASNYSEWNLTYPANMWIDVFIDLTSPDSTTGSLDLSSVSEITILKTTADTTTYSHNIDNLIALKDDYKEDYAYDSNGNVSSVTYYQDGSLMKTVSFTYDSEGNVIKITTS